jgi:hypothetical protein
MGVNPAGGGATAAVERRPEVQHCRRQASRARAHVREEEEEREGGPGDLFEISRKFKNLSVNYDFSLLQRSNEKMLNMKVVEFFKLYNIALGLKFRNSKFTTFYVKFLNKGRI